MKIAKTTIIRHGDEQILELPEDMAFPDDVQEVEIFKQGTSIVIVPRGEKQSEIEKPLPLPRWGRGKMIWNFCEPCATRESKRS